MSGASQVMSHHHFDQPTRYGHPKGVDKRIIDAMPHVPAAGGPQKVRSYQLSQPFRLLVSNDFKHNFYTVLSTV